MSDLAADRPRLRKRAKAAWRAMWKRCSAAGGKDWKHYGGRGIRVSKRWASFDLFLEDLGLPPTPAHWLGRLDVNGNYEVGNCEWTTRQTQVGRRRVCHRVDINGGLPTIAAAARALGVSETTLRRRLLLQHRPLREAVCTLRLRRRDSMLLCHRQVTLPLPVWARLVGVSCGVLWRRIQLGWPLDQALHAPVGAPRGGRAPNARATNKR